jgi:hypothetical protein
MHPEPGFAEEAERLLRDGMTYSQPALFAVEYALAECWRSWGHHAGRGPRAQRRGVCSGRDRRRSSRSRTGFAWSPRAGRLMDALVERGAMLAVFDGSRTGSDRIVSEDPAPTSRSPWSTGRREVVVSGVCGGSSRDWSRCWKS